MRTSASVAPPSVSGDERDAGCLHLGLRARLVAHPLHHVRAGADEDEVVVLARADEGRVLGEEAVAGMDRLAAGRPGGGDHVRDPQVALAADGGPMQTARSARRTCSASRSAVE